MDDEERLGIKLDFWDDTVGAFEPEKVLHQLQRAFPNVEINPTDHQRVGCSASWNSGHGIRSSPNCEKR